MKPLKMLLVAIIAINLVFLATSPTFRHGDDLRYLVIADEISTTGDFAPVTMFDSSEFYHPPLFTYIMVSLHMLIPNISLWLFSIKAFSFLCFIGSLVIILDLMKKYNLREEQKIVALGLFAFFPVTLSVSTAIMADMLTLFLSLFLIKTILKEQYTAKEYFLMFIFSGMLALTKYTIGIVGLSLVLYLFIAKRKEKWKASLSMIAGSSVIGGWWYLRNATLFGDPFYLGYYTSLVPQTIFDAVRNIMLGHLSIFSIPNPSKLASYFSFIDITTANILIVASVALMFPMIVMFVKNYKKHWKKYKDIFPLVALFVMFSMYFSYKAGDFGIRYFFVVLPFCAFILSEGISFNKWRRPLLSYFAVVIIVLLAISITMHSFMIRKDSNIMNGLEQIHEKYPDRDLYNLTADDELMRIEKVIYGTEVKMLDSPPDSCEIEDQINTIKVCVSGDIVAIGREKSFVGDMPSYYYKIE